MAKRFFDILLSFLLLIFLLPLFFIIVIIIVVDSKGGPLFLQQRVGKNEGDFNIIKFRTMHHGSEGKGLLTIGEEDPRITRIGKWLRKYKLDELPQLFNILKGEMSFVGPRPEVRKYVNLYTNHQKQVLTVKPGLTDYASLQYINENELLARYTDPEKAYIEMVMPAKIALNLKYIKDQSLFTDFKIIGYTIKKIMLGKK
jgi:lipopolysaccharide/colanic/teichoic acid biosynthesis glycosyltransferase